MSKRRRMEQVHPNHRERIVRPLPPHEQMRGRDRRGTSPNTPMEHALSRLLEERDLLREQLENVRGLAERALDISEQKDQRIHELEGLLAQKQAEIEALEQENLALLQQGAGLSERVGQLENSLRMFAEADDRLEEILAERAK